MVRLLVLIAATGGLAAHAAEAQCKSDVECPGREVCSDGKCVVPGQSSPSSGSSSAPRSRSLSTLTSTPSFAFQIGVFGELFPSSDRKVPGTSQGQMSVFAGARLGAGVHLFGWADAFANIELGYAAAGRAPGNGDDGVMLGLGVEAAFARMEAAQPFVRLTYALRVAEISSNSNGTLAENAVTFALGVKLAKVIDLHVLLGNDYAGGSSVGIGLGFFGLK